MWMFWGCGIVDGTGCDYCVKNYMGTRSMIPELGLMHFHGKAKPETRRGAADVGTKTGLGCSGLPGRTAWRAESACSQVTWPYALWERNFQVSQTLVLNHVFVWKHGTLRRAILYKVIAIYLWVFLPSRNGCITFIFVRIVEFAGFHPTHTTHWSKWRPAK